jgi:hypothetical protein
MNTRRNFLKSVGVLGFAGVGGITVNARAAGPLASAEPEPDNRAFWLGVLDRLATPVLENLSRRELKKNMPVEAASPADRAQSTHLEAFGRLMAGIAPWLAAQGLDENEKKKQAKFIALARASLDAATDPRSPDFMNFTHGGQPLVDAAFLAQGILRAPTELWQTLDAKLQSQIVAALKSSRVIGTPTKNNWVMFAATIEAALHTMGERTIKSRLEGCVEQMLAWYKGDGAYGDGEFFHFDYYNSFVIHPMLLDVLAVLKQRDEKFAPVHKTVLRRAQRYAVIQERLIAPDGTFPSIGRSTAYRFGAFHLLAQIALLEKLSEPVRPAQVRSGLAAVIKRMIDAPGTFDTNGWLQIGFCGHQPALAEAYISTGSLYLCSTALLPLGLPPANEFWSAPAAPWTARQLWAGQDLHADHAIADS